MKSKIFYKRISAALLGIMLPTVASADDKAYPLASENLTNFNSVWFDGDTYATELTSLWKTPLGNTDADQTLFSMTKIGNVIYLCVQIDPLHYSSHEGCEKLFLRRFNALTGEEMESLAIPFPAMSASMPSTDNSLGDSRKRRFAAIVTKDEADNLITVRYYAPAIPETKMRLHINVVNLGDTPEFDAQERILDIEPVTSSWKLVFCTSNNTQVDYSLLEQIHSLKGNVREGNFEMEATLAQNLQTTSSGTLYHGLYATVKCTDGAMQLVSLSEPMPADTQTAGYQPAGHMHVEMLDDSQLTMLQAVSLIYLSNTTPFPRICKRSTLNSAWVPLSEQESGANSLLTNYFGTSLNRNNLGFHIFQHNGHRFAFFATKTAKTEGSTFAVSSWDDASSFANLKKLWSDNFTLSNSIKMWDAYYRHLLVVEKINEKDYLSNSASGSRAEAVGTKGDITDLYFCSPGIGIAAYRMQTLGTEVTLLPSVEKAPCVIAVTNSALKVSGLADSEELCITDIAGRTICRATLSPENATLSVSHLTPGIYIARLSSGVSAKFIR